MDHVEPRVLLITGTVGVGKTTVAYEMGDVLAEHEVANGVIDLDALRGQFPPDSLWNSDLMFENLAAVWPNYEARGVRHLVLAGVVQERADLARYRDAVPGCEVRVVRLTADHHVRERRLRQRIPPSSSLDWHLARTGELEEILETASIEDLLVSNGDRSVRGVAIEVLHEAGCPVLRSGRDHRQRRRIDSSHAGPEPRGAV